MKSKQHSFEIKVKLINDYLNKEGEYQYLDEKYIYFILKTNNSCYNVIKT